MFDGFVVYKQWHSKQCRWYAYLYDPTTKYRTTMSWARYKMSKKLGRLLDKDTETVDHINGDKSDDRMVNLQLLTRGDNNRKSARPKNMVELVCPNCGVVFSREFYNTHLNKGRGTNNTFCSRKCCGYYSHKK